MTPDAFLVKSGAGRILVWGLALLGFGVSGWALWTTGKLSLGLVNTLNFRLLAAVLIALVLVALRALRLQIMAAATGESIKFRGAARITLIGDLAAGISPGRAAGEPARWAALRRLGISQGRAGAILAGEFAADLLTLFCIVPAVLLLSSYASLTRIPVHLSLPPILGMGVASLTGLFLLGHQALNHLEALTGAAVGLLQRLPTATPVLGKRKMAVVEEVNRAAHDFHSRLHELARYGKRQWACVCLISLGHAVARLALLPAVAWGIGAKFSIVPLALWECAVYYGLAFVPLPGGGGTAESASLFYLSSHFPAEEASLLLIFWRFFDCYLLVGLGSFALLFKNESGIPLSSLVSAAPARRLPPFPKGSSRP